MPFEIGPKAIESARPLSAVAGGSQPPHAPTGAGEEAAAVTHTGGAGTHTGGAAKRSAVPGAFDAAASKALDPGPAPVDTDRVAQIRRAIERGEYPILPAKMADAMIAAGLLLRSGK